MQLESEDIVNQFRLDWPHEAEVSTLRLLCTKQAAEIDRLNALQASSTYTASSPRPYVAPPVGEGTRVDLEPRHG
jgi:hypothetical protein